MTRKVRLDRFYKPFGVWLDDAAGMICKCAEADALRSSFPTMLGGLYMREELSPVIEIEGPKFQQPANRNEPLPATATTQAEPEPNRSEPQPAGEQTAQPSSKSNDPLSPQETVCKIVITNGYTFDQFKIWAVGIGILVEADSLTSFDEIPLVKAKKMIEGEKGMLKGLAAIKAAAKKEGK